METTSPNITAVMLVRDRADLLEASARSVLAQAGVELELVILDDGSVDATPEVAERLAARDARVRILTNVRSRGIPAARNQVLAAARGQYLAVCDSDDLLEPTAYAKQSRLLDADDRLGGAGVRLSVFRGDPADGAEPDWHWGLRDGRLPFVFSGAMFRTEALREAGGFDERWPIAEDVHLGYRLAGKGWQFATVPEVLVHIRVHDGSISQSRVLQREWYNLRAQCVGLRELRGRFSFRGYAVVCQSVLRVGLAAAGLRRR